MRYAFAFLFLLLCACGDQRQQSSDLIFKSDREELIFRRIVPKDEGIDYPTFFLLETEVTNAQYADFLQDRGLTKDDDDVLKEVEEQKKQEQEAREATTKGIKKWILPKRYFIEDLSTLWRDGTYPKDMAQHPVTLITMEDALAYCAWLNTKFPDAGTFRLPSWNEWMIAAYGKDRKYPWGDQWDPTFVHMSLAFPFTIPHITEERDHTAKRPTKTEDVRARPQGRTPQGLFGMNGNVEEMICDRDPTCKDYFNCGMRWMGGSFSYGSLIFADKDKTLTPREDYWGYSHSSADRQNTLGFRVLLDPSRDSSLPSRPRIFPPRNRSWMDTSR